mgnify:CR=1 FL=1
MSTDRLAEIRARADAAAAGPWTWNGYRVPDLMGRAGDPETFEYDIEVIEATHSGECGCRSLCELELTVGPADREFIAHARQDIPHLLDLIDRVRAAVAEHRTSQGPAATVPVWAIQEALDGGEGA